MYSFLSCLSSSHFIIFNSSVIALSICLCVAPCFVWGAHSLVLRSCFWLWTQGSFLARLGVLGIKSMWTCIPVKSLPFCTISPAPFTTSLSCLFGMVIHVDSVFASCTYIMNAQIQRSLRIRYFFLIFWNKCLEEILLNH